MKDKLKQEIDAYLEEVVPNLVDLRLAEQKLKELERDQLATCTKYQLGDLKRSLGIYSGPSAPPCTVIHGL